MKKAVLLLLTLLLALTPVWAMADIDVVDYTADFYVADYADVLSDEVEGLIVLNNDELYKACGAQIVVVTVDTVGGANLENYTYTLFNEWGIGDKSKNNGLLILIAVQDGQFWIMSGKGLQDYLTAGDTDEMAAEHFVPSASTGDFDTGVRQLFAACFEKVSIAYDAGVTLNDTLYYTYLQTGSNATGGAKFLSEPVREMPVGEVNDPVIEATREPGPQPVRRDEGGGFSFMSLIIILVVLIVIVGAVGTLRSRPGRQRPVPPPPRRPVAPPPRPPMNGGFGGPAPRPAPRPVPRPPQSGFGSPSPRPAPRPAPRPPASGGFGGSSPRPAPRPAPRPPVSGGQRSSGGFGGARPGGGVTRGGGSGGSFSRPSGPSRPMGGRSSGGFGGGRSGGGGSTRGGGSGGRF